jgi:glyoxylase-like metal-dependent hydrolase (beta-lactamase superfamily II)
LVDTFSIARFRLTDTLSAEERRASTMSDPTDATPEVPASVADTTPAFTLGDIAGHIISDGEVPYATDFVYANAPAEELSTGLAGRLDERGELWLPYHCLLITTLSHNLLIDAGLGRALSAAWDVPAGRMLDGLAKLGFSPNDIDVVVISHAHPDHIGGLSDGDNPTFPRARHVIEAREWACWTEEDQLARLPDGLTTTARTVLPLLARADLVDVVQGEVELISGVRLVPAPGHTLGHCVVAFGSGSQQAIFVADAILDRLQLTHPEWVSAVDMLPDETNRHPDTAAGRGCPRLEPRSRLPRCRDRPDRTRRWRLPDVNRAITSRASARRVSQPVTQAGVNNELFPR